MYMPTITAVDFERWRTQGCVLDPPDESFVRGVMVILHGLVSKPELNGRHGLVLGPLASGRAPVAIAPVQDTEHLIQISVKPANCALPPEPPDRLATAWNNLALAYKRAGASAYDQAAAAYETALKLQPGKPNFMANYIKLCLVMAGERRGDPEVAQALQEKAGKYLSKLFRPVTTLPENRGLDCNLGIDFVPGYSQRMLTAGVVNSVDAQPARTTYARQWVYDPQREALQEINPGDGKPLTMSAEAREAISRGHGTHVQRNERGETV